MSLNFELTSPLRDSPFALPPSKQPGPLLGGVRQNREQRLDSRGFQAPKGVEEFLPTIPPEKYPPVCGVGAELLLVLENEVLRLTSWGVHRPWTEHSSMLHNRWGQSDSK